MGVYAKVQNSFSPFHESEKLVIKIQETTFYLDVEQKLLEPVN